ncbi:MAG: Gfo/Idh/MocA family oxidoreductase [Clostridia bacterium]|nr:Gfo/Idh/MocA family oxidoreductase [Clostridia bacterium]
MIRFGIIGVGNIGMLHAEYLVKNEIKNACLSAVCDIDCDKLKNFSDRYGDEIKRFENYKEMIKSGEVDAVIVATPHYLHPQMTIDCFEAKLHVIVEKPIGVYVKNTWEMINAAKESGKVFAVMYCMRTDPYYKKIKELLDDEELGKIKRVNWIATEWYRPQAYHNSSSWRSSWEGEGGGVLVNQSPHNLDIIQWMFGLPKKVTAFAKYGKYYDIEVEDEVTAYMDYEDFSCVYIASTGEAPGSSRVEIIGTMGKLIYENGKIYFKRNRVSERKFNETNQDIFGVPEAWEMFVPPCAGAMKHRNITQNFVNAILQNEALIAGGESGINELMLSNAIHLSSWQNKTVELPVDEDIFLKELKGKIKESKGMR